MGRKHQRQNLKTTCILSNFGFALNVRGWQNSHSIAGLQFTTSANLRITVYARINYLENTLAILDMLTGSKDRIFAICNITMRQMFRRAQPHSPMCWLCLKNVVQINLLYCKRVLVVLYSISCS